MDENYYALVCDIMNEFWDKDDIDLDILKHILVTLTPREVVIVQMRYGLDHYTPHTFRAIGEHFNVTHERVRQICIKALRKLRHPQRLRKYVISVRQDDVKRQRVQAYDYMCRSPLDTPIDELLLSARAHNVLKDAQINTVGKLVASNDKDLLKQRNMGIKTLLDIRNVVSKFLSEDSLRRIRIRKELDQIQGAS